MNIYKPSSDKMQSIKFSTYSKKSDINSVFFYKCNQYKLKEGDILRVAQLNKNNGVYRYHYRVVISTPFVSDDESLRKYDTGHGIKNIDKDSYNQLIKKVGL